MMAAFLALLLPGPSPAAQAPVPALAEADPAFVEAVELRDMRRPRDQYAADAVLLAPHGEIVKGRARIEAFWKRFQSRGLRELRLLARRSSATGVLGYEMGTYELQVEDAQGARVETGEFLSVFQRDKGGRWRVVYDVLNNLPKAAP